MYKRLTRDPRNNNGIAAGKEFVSEAEFHKFLRDWIDGRVIDFVGQENETKESSEWQKARRSPIQDAEINPDTDSGIGDIGIEHTHLELAWNHLLASPLIIECKLSKFREAVAQAVRYKADSKQKYAERGRYKILKTVIATPRSLSTGEIAGRHTGQDPFPINFESKRIYWKLGIGVAQSVRPSELVISFNEADVVVIR